VGEQAEHAVRHKAGFRPHAGFIVGITLFAATFLAVLLSEFHTPSPRGIPVGIVAPATVTGQVEEALDNAIPGGFDLRIYPSEAAAQAAVVHDEVDGALIASPRGLQLLEAKAGGVTPAQALTTAMGAIAAHSGKPLTVTDLVPPLPNDSDAFSPFFVTLGILIPSLAGGSASALLFRRSRTWGVAAPIVMAVVLAAVGAGIADGVAGLGNYLAIAGIVALFSLAVAAPTATLARIKPPLSALAVLVFIVVSIPVSGGPSGLAAFGPGFLRVLHPALPLGVAANAVRSAVYFDGYGTAGPLWTLAAWAAAGVAALALVIAWRQRALAVPPETGTALAAAAGNGRHAAGHGQLTQEAAVASDALPARVAGASAWPGPDGPRAAAQAPAGTAVFAGAAGQPWRDRSTAAQAPAGTAVFAGAAGQPWRDRSTAAQTPAGTAVLPDAAGQPGWDRQGPFTSGNVVVGFDNSEPAQRALSEAAWLVAARSGILHVVYADHVIIDSDLSGFAHAEMVATRYREAAWVAEAAADIVAQAGIPYTFERREEAPVHAILSAAGALAGAFGGGPIIMVGRSRHAGRHPFGSVPDRLLHHSPYPVFTIP
jgi:nucleotide-binding universal stress UspA family protein